MKKTLTALLLLLPAWMMAQQVIYVQQAESSQRRESRIFTGWSLGVSAHAGYSFADSPEQLFGSSQQAVETLKGLKGLPKSGVSLGAGATLRLHLINHIHVGAEGFVSTMPFDSKGSQVKSLWGAGLVDYYAHWGRIRPYIGASLGGGNISKLILPDGLQEKYDKLTNGSAPKRAEGTGSEDENTCNAYMEKEAFLSLTPYLGLEIPIGNAALSIRADWMLPFRTNGKVLKEDIKNELGETIKMTRLITPSGPRLHVGIVFGKLHNK